MQDLLFQLPDGRTLGYAVYGPDDGQPVLYFHGTPSSRLEPLITLIYDLPLPSLLASNHLKLIAVDRPGMGTSAYDENRTFSSFAADAAFLLQHLGIERCALLCWSGGGPYALAMAFLYPQLIHSLFIITGFSCSFSEEEVYGQMGWNKLYFKTAQAAPLVMHAALEVVKHIKISTPISQGMYDLSHADYAYLKDVHKLNAFLDLTVKQALENGADGAIQEAALYFEPFPYRLQEIGTPVHFWWGTEDFTVGYIHAKRMERELPHVVPHYKPGEGHLSLYIKYLPEILSAISVWTNTPGSSKS